jgi:ABC-type siderophore export system fused ATPase/permease subunit/CubicO group peptidase (beta-lactamase class C family)
LHADDSKATGLSDIASIEKEVRELMEEGDIPGLALVIIKGDELIVKGFGYADLEAEIPATADTLFEMGSCSKAYTALAVVQLADRQLIKLDDNVSVHLPWFTVTYDGEPREITIRQLLHQTGGIPWNAITRIPRGDFDGALTQTVKNISGMALEHEPGTNFLYSTVNYDILGAIIEKVSGVSFEEYMVENIFKPLDLTSTLVGADQRKPPPGMAKGYKIGFYKPRLYTAPVYRGNNPAGYIVSNGKDVAHWLKFQMGAAETPMKPLIDQTHTPDISVEPDPNALASYAMGWVVRQYGKGGISHAGGNPNFTTYITFNKQDKTGVAVLANSNSVYTSFIANTVLTRLYGKTLDKKFSPGTSLDESCTVIAFIVGGFFLSILLFYGYLVRGLVKGKRHFEPLNGVNIGRLFRTLLLYLPFLLGIYLLPKALNDVTWDMAFVWSPSSFQVTIYMILASMAFSYIALFLSTLFPEKNKYLKSAPSLIILSLITGGANAVIIFLVTSSIYLKDNILFILYYFALALVLYIAGRKVLQTKLVEITMDIVFDLRMQLIGKVFLTSYQRFERIEDGRVLATLNNDTGQIGNSANIFVQLISSIITVLGVFIYLATIAFWATAVTVAVIIAVATLYYVVGTEAQKYLEEARTTQNKYLSLLNGMVDGFKELSLHIKKRFHYKEDLEGTCDQFRGKTVIANVKLINAFLVGESLLIVILGAVGFGVPHIFPAIKNVTLMSFIIALLYLIGPINGILGSMPGILQIRVAWGRVKGFTTSVPANMNPEDIGKPLEVEKDKVDKLEAKGLFFEYKPLEEEESKPALAADDKNKKQAAIAAGTGENIEPAAEPETKNENEAKEKEKMFSVGPLELSANKGEIIFIVGGNGSGKTTLAKLLTGLYTSDEGSIKVNGKEIPNHQLGEYFSVVFGDYHLFQKLYEVDLTGNEDEAEKYIDLLEMRGKVEIVNNEFSTINLSGGQRKRLALMQCYLEDSPIYLFDEVAADQDPQFRKFFYRKLLAKMKEEGKIVIAITHDDHYFDVADKVVKMDLGQVENVADGAAFRVTN